MCKAVSRRPVIAESRLQSQAGPDEAYGEYWNRFFFFLLLLRFSPVSIILPKLHTHTSFINDVVK